MQPDFGAALARLAKYLLEGSTVGFAAYFIPKSKPSLEEVLLIAVVAAVFIAIHGGRVTITAANRAMGQHCTI